MILFVVYGAWLSLVERTVRDREVAGSNPVAPTIDRKRDFLIENPFLFICAGMGAHSKKLLTGENTCETFLE
jgi:hypothetical protein